MAEPQPGTELTPAADPASATLPMPSLTPAVPMEVNLTLTITFTSLYGLLFILVFTQLLLILYYKHRRFSYQSVFLFICLIWAALRTTLFAFHFKNCDCYEAYRLPGFWRWLLYEFPVFLQYLTLCLLAFYFAKAVLKTKWNMEPQKYRKCLWVTFAVLIFLFLTVTVVYTIITSVVHVNWSENTHRAIGICRVAVSQILFVLTAFALCVCILQLKRVSSANLLLEGQGTTICQATVVCIIIGLLFLSRAVYDLLAVSLTSLPTFGYGWIYVSDEGETVKGGTLHSETGSNGFVSFAAVLLIWEILPTFIVVWFFRVRRPAREALVTNTLQSNNFRTSVFDNLRRYDSDADLYVTTHSPPLSRYEIPSNSINGRASLQNYSEISGRRGSSYGNRPNSFQSGNSNFVPGTTPPLLFSGSQHYQPGRHAPGLEHR